MKTEKIKEVIENILLELHDDLDYRKEQRLVDDKLFDSFDLVTLVAELGMELSIDVTAEDFVPENFNSLEALTAMAERLMEG
ncbi:MAG: acyl carrier protein [Lachnospiraceae bacterium]|nr:acyl carrier protein [Lachnospiraceae bacterium]